MRAKMLKVTIVMVLLLVIAQVAALWGEGQIKARGISKAYMAFAFQQIRPQRTVGRRPGARSSTSQLPSKARTVTGGGGYGGICDLTIVPEGVEIFAVFPENGFIELQKPHVTADLVVQPCHLVHAWGGPSLIDNAYTYTLMNSNGEVILEQTPEDMWDIAWLDVPNDVAAGTYTLTITGPWRSYSQQFEVEQYKGPRVELLDPATNVDVAGKTEPGFERNGGLSVHAYGFPPVTTLELGLYQVDEMDRLQLIDSWLVKTDSVGEHQDLLFFAPNTEPGGYTLIICAVNNCDLTFADILKGPGGYPNAILPPSVAWNWFVLGDLGAVGANAQAFNFMRCDGPCTDNSTPVVSPVPEQNRRMFVQWEYNNIPVGATYTRSWKVLGKGEWVRHECEWAGPSDGIQRSTIYGGEGGLYSGTWELVITVEGEEILRETVKVAGDTKYWAPLGVIYDDCQ